jgi:hypothetical protein
MASMASPVPSAFERLTNVRYPTRLRLAIRLVDASTKEPCVSARSGKLSGNGVLLYRDCIIPESSSLKLTVDGRPEPFLLTVYGKVLRSHPHSFGKFAIAARCDFSSPSFIGNCQELGTL